MLNNIIIKKSQEFSFYKLIKISENDLIENKENYYYNTIKRIRSFTYSSKEENKIKNQFYSIFPNNKNIYSLNWYLPNLKIKNEFLVQDTNLYSNKTDKELVNFIHLNLIQLGYYTYNEDLILSRLNKIGNLNNSNIFGIIKIIDKIISDYSDKEYCKSCYCIQNEIFECNCYCHNLLIYDTNLIEENVSVNTLDKYSFALDNSIMNTKIEDEEEDKKKHLNIKIKVTQIINEEEDYENFDILDQINKNGNYAKSKNNVNSIFKKMANDDKLKKIADEEKLKKIEDEEKINENKKLNKKISKNIVDDKPKIIDDKIEDIKKLPDLKKSSDKKFDKKLSNAFAANIIKTNIPITTTTKKTPINYNPKMTSVHSILRRNVVKTNPQIAVRDMSNQDLNKLYDSLKK